MIMRLHRSYVMEEKRQLKQKYTTDRTANVSIHMVSSIIIVQYSTSYGQKAKAKAAHRRGQGRSQGSSRLRPQNFVLKVSEVEASPRRPIPELRHRFLLLSMMIHIALTYC